MLTKEELPECPVATTVSLIIVVQLSRQKSKLFIMN